MSVTKVQPQMKQDTLQNAQDLFEKNQKFITAVSAILFVGLVALIGFYQWYLPEQEAEAQIKMFPAVSFFENDNYEVALNGDGNNVGLISIANNYSFTKAANLANYYIGLSYLNTGKFEEAITHLKKFDTDDAILGATALGAIGDAYFELGKNQEGISYYKKAVEKNKNEFTAPIYLLRIAMAYRVEKNNAEAAKYFKKLKAEYPNTTEGLNAEKYLARIGE